MRKHGLKVPVSGDVLEIVGTGGDEANTINISTAASIVTAAAGYKVAKHTETGVCQAKAVLPTALRRSVSG